MGSVVVLLGDIRSAHWIVGVSGAAMGTLGLIAFAILVWRFLPGHSSLIVLPAAGLAWLAISMLVWWIRKAV
jgi:hypothetical protein